MPEDSEADVQTGIPEPSAAVAGSDGPKASGPTAGAAETPIPDGVYPVYPTTRNSSRRMMWKLSLTVSRMVPQPCGKVVVKKRMIASAKVRKSS